MILLPDPEILIGDCAKPNPSWTNALNVPVVNVAIIKYASFVRGEASCERRGFSSSVFPRFAVTKVYGVLIEFCLNTTILMISLNLTMAPLDCWTPSSSVPTKPRLPWERWDWDGCRDSWFVGEAAVSSCGDIIDSFENGVGWLQALARWRMIQWAFDQRVHMNLKPVEGMCFWLVVQKFTLHILKLCSAFIIIVRSVSHS